MTSPDDERIGKRLKAAREALGLTQEDVASKVGFNQYQTLLNIEKGQRPIKVSELVKLCDVYHKDSSYFLLEEEPGEAIFSFAWRDKNKNQEFNEIDARLRKVVEDYKLLEALNNEETESYNIALPEDFKITDYPNIEELSKNIVDQYKLGYRPGINLADIMENELGIRIIYYDLSGYGSGVTTLDETKNVTVIINMNEVPGRRNFDLAHEFFHILTSKIYPLPDLDYSKEGKKHIIEKYADAFASNFLLPSESIKKELIRKGKDKSISYIDLISIAMEFGVSTEPLLWRISRIYKIAPEKIKAILASEEFKNLDSEAREGKKAPAQKFSQRFIRLGLNALREGKISKGKFCKIFEINRAEFPSFLMDYGFNEDYIYSDEIEINYS